MKPSHDVRQINLGTGRFSGYKLKRDLEKNIIDNRNFIPQPGYWKTRAISPPDNMTPYPYRGNA